MKHEDKYCEKCGTKMLVYEKSDGFDIKTGAPAIILIYKRPNFQAGILSTNGHHSDATEDFRYNV